jgi:hypothetical protein
LRQRLQFLFENRRPAGKLIAVAILKRVLVLRLARPAADLDVLPDLHEQSNPLHPAHFRLQAGDDLAGGRPALLSGLQVDHHPTLAHGRVRADPVIDVIHIRVGHDDVA